MIETQNNAPVQTSKKTPAKKAATKASTAKNANKNIRAEIGVETSANQMSEADQIRMATGKTMKMDWEHYTRNPEYANMRFYGCHLDDIDGQIQIGAKPVPKQSKARKIYAGLNDHASSEYEYVQVGKDEAGAPILCYLLMMEKELYHKLKIQPNIDRNNMIRKSMGVGMLNNDGQTVMPGVTNMKTYAPLTSVNGETVGDGHPGLATHVSTDEDIHDV